MVQVRNRSDHVIEWLGTTWQPGQDIDVPFWRSRGSKPEELVFIPAFRGGGGGRTLGINVRSVLNS